MRIKGRNIAANRCDIRSYSLPLAVATAVCCTIVITSHLAEVKNSNTNLRQTTASSNALHGVLIPQGKAVALPSVRINSEESEKIDRKIYGGDGGEFIENSILLIILRSIYHTATEDIEWALMIISFLTIVHTKRQGASWWIYFV